MSMAWESGLGVLSLSVISPKLGILSAGIGGLSATVEGTGMGFWSSLAMAFELSRVMLMLKSDCKVVGLETVPASVPGSRVILILERESEGMGEESGRVVAIDPRLRVWV
jgi:hypothetical protein